MSVSVVRNLLVFLLVIQLLIRVYYVATSTEHLQKHSQSASAPALAIYSFPLFPVSQRFKG